MFIFATVGSALPRASTTRTRYTDGSMTWTGVGSSHSGQKQIQSILDVGGHRTHVFVREAEGGPFVYLGITRSVEVHGDRPVRVHLRFGEEPTSRKPEVRSFREGAPRDVT